MGPKNFKHTPPLLQGALQCFGPAETFRHQSEMIYGAGKQPATSDQSVFESTLPQGGVSQPAELLIMRPAAPSEASETLQLYDEILKTQEEGKDSACVFLDCSAAFDTIQHDVLLGKMRLYGVTEKSLAWMKDYLSDRSQYVSIGGIPSEIKKIEDGAFQGSIGGPWCFLIMINDIVVVAAGSDITVYIYADDTCLRVTLGEDMDENQEKLDELMKKIVRYMDATKLKFNFKKTEFVVTSPKKHDKYSRLVLNFDGNMVKQQLHARLLGLQVSWDLQHKWYVSEMKDNLLASLRKRLYILERLAPSCPKKCVKNFAHGLIFSKLCFRIQYWSKPLPEALWNQIVVIVNRAARAVLGNSPIIGNPSQKLNCSS